MLQKRQIIEDGPIPPLPRRAPRQGDDVLGVSFFRTLVGDASFDRLCLPRTFFGRSEIRSSSFRDADLSESTANWNDFIDVDFERADLSRCDLRGCNFERARFVRATLIGADLRRCGFVGCDFAEAILDGAHLTRAAGDSLNLSSGQRAVIAWHVDDGDEPEGG